MKTKYKCKHNWIGYEYCENLVTVGVGSMTALEDSKTVSILAKLICTKCNKIKDI